MPFYHQSQQTPNDLVTEIVKLPVRPIFQRSVEGSSVFLLA